MLEIHASAIEMQRNIWTTCWTDSLHVVPYVGTQIWSGKLNFRNRMWNRMQNPHTSRIWDIWSVYQSYVGGRISGKSTCGQHTDRMFYIRAAYGHPISHVDRAYQYTNSRSFASFSFLLYSKLIFSPLFTLSHQGKSLLELPH